ncbi:hypothetical protein [Parafrankia sp. EUN1f]|uniref:hypothetical protein n=1 Tax=Parafrankia sp. EUN1f TaxID=102897 RepID=UPI0012FAE450|nr:hypothetical protein [Parafrankia sp. EUN1f]
MGHVTNESDPRLLGTYLNDHLAGAGTGVDLAHRLARVHHGTPAGPALARTAAAVEQDRATLLQIMGMLGVPRRGYKELAGRVAEKVGRLKLNNRLLRRSPMSSVIELETLWLGVNGKSRLWRTLRAVANRDARLSPELLDHLLDRAREQADELEDLRGHAVNEAFAAQPHRV